MSVKTDFKTWSFAFEKEPFPQSSEADFKNSLVKNFSSLVLSLIDDLRKLCFVFSSAAGWPWTSPMLLGVRPHLSSEVCLSVPSDRHPCLPRTAADVVLSQLLCSALTVP